MPRRRSTWGSNTDAGGGYRRLRYWADEHDGRGYVRHSKTIKGTRRQGDEELARLRVAHSQDRPVPTVKQAYETWWLPEALARVDSERMTRSTLKNYQSRWNAHIRPALGDLPVSDVRPLVIRDWLQGISSGISNSALVMLRQILDLCVLYECIDANPARGVMPTTIRAKAKERDKTTYTAEEMEGALSAVKGTAAYIPAILCGLGSCRVGEALGVRCDEVEEVEANGTIVAVVPISRQADRAGDVSDTLKTPRQLPRGRDTRTLVARRSRCCAREPAGRLAHARRRWRAALAVHVQHDLATRAQGRGRSVHPATQPAQLVAHHRTVGTRDTGRPA